MHPFYKTASLISYVHRKRIVPLQSIFHMLGRVNPGQMIIIEKNLGKLKLLVGEMNVLCLGFNRILVSTELEIVTLGKLLQMLIMACDPILLGQRRMMSSA